SPLGARRVAVLGGGRAGWGAADGARSGAARSWLRSGGERRAAVTARPLLGPHARAVLPAKGVRWPGARGIRMLDEPRRRTRRGEARPWWAVSGAALAAPLRRSGRRLSSPDVARHLVACRPHRAVHRRLQWRFSYANSICAGLVSVAQSAYPGT